MAVRHDMMFSLGVPLDEVDQMLMERHPGGMPIPMSVPSTPAEPMKLGAVRGGKRIRQGIPVLYPLGMFGVSAMDQGHGALRVADLGLFLASTVDGHEIPISSGRETSLAAYTLPPGLVKPKPRR